MADGIPTEELGLTEKDMGITTPKLKQATPVSPPPLPQEPQVVPSTEIKSSEQKPREAVRLVLNPLTNSWVEDGSVGEGADLNTLAIYKKGGLSKIDRETWKDFLAANPADENGLVRFDLGGMTGKIDTTTGIFMPDAAGGAETRLPEILPADPVAEIERKLERAISIVEGLPKDGFGDVDILYKLTTMIKDTDLAYDNPAEEKRLLDILKVRSGVDVVFRAWKSCQGPDSEEKLADFYAKRAIMVNEQTWRLIEGVRDGAGNYIGGGMLGVAAAIDMIKTTPGGNYFDPERCTVPNRRAAILTHLGTLGLNSREAETRLMLAERKMKITSDWVMQTVAGAKLVQGLRTTDAEAHGAYIIKKNPDNKKVQEAKSLITKSLGAFFTMAVGLKTK